MAFSIDLWLAKLSCIKEVSRVVTMNEMQLNYVRIVFYPFKYFKAEALKLLENKRLILKNILREWRCNLVCIQETKLEDVKLSDIRSIGGNQYSDFVALKAQGTAGGIIVG